MGCAMNIIDSNHIAGELKEKDGYDLTTDETEADLIIINTCSVREKPVNKLFSEIGQFTRKKKDGAKIGVCGCTASHLGNELFKKNRDVSFVLGARNVSKIHEAVNTDKYVETSIVHDESQYSFATSSSNMYTSLINISIGCDKKCTYCIVPATRGKEISVPADLIIAEVKKSVAKGAVEIFLIGQNVNGYGKRFSEGKGKIDFTDLLRLVSEVDGVERIRFTSPHPLHMDDKFLEEFTSNSKICKSMHMPLQSGSSHILKEMKRGYDKEWFLERALKLREMCPEVSISTDIIVGFPGESEADFLDSLDVIKQVKFEQIFSFVYSKRPHTPAQDYTNQIELSLAKKRLYLLQEYHGQMLDNIVHSKMNETFRVYFDELRADGYVSGKTDTNFTVKVQGSENLLGTFANVKIHSPRRLNLYGDIV